MQKLGIVYIQTKFKVLGVFSKQYAARQAFQLFCTPQLRSKRKGAPANAAPLRFSLNGITICGHRWNHPQPKKALLLHGFNSAAYKFERYVEPLVKKGYEVLAFDAPAHGDSGGKQVNAVVYRDMILAIQSQFGPINSFIAHSFGGIALCLALEQIPNTSSTKVVLIAPATETTSAIDSAFAMLKIKNTAIRSAFDNIIKQISGHTPEWFSVKRIIPHLQANVLWIHDEDDDITPLQDVLPLKNNPPAHVQFLITKGLGHRRIYHDTEVKKAIIGFL
ncbi:MAG: alpha/beta fold hydrolase [Bacteroidetes bacterium]|nr:alpha/beta fold hydrolase [Bacteroidota bacterium]